MGKTKTLMEEYEKLDKTNEDRIKVFCEQKYKGLNSGSKVAESLGVLYLHLLFRRSTFCCSWCLIKNTPTIRYKPCYSITNNKDIIHESGSQFCNACALAYARRTDGDILCYYQHTVLPRLKENLIGENNIQPENQWLTNWYTESANELMALKQKKRLGCPNTLTPYDMRALTQLIKEKYDTHVNSLNQPTTNNVKEDSQGLRSSNSLTC